MSKANFSFSKRLQSFKYAFAGLKSLIKDEHNSRVHLFAASIAVTAGILLEITKTEWFVILILIGLVFSAELFNSAIENICDLVSPEKNDLVKKAKDQAAGAVLVIAMVAAIVGLWIFVPKIIEM
ncbi:MAG: diacylglycerol kinase family protein [Bacteroidota bacterium]